MPQTKEVEDFLKSIGPFYEIADSEEEVDGERPKFNPSELDDVTGETTNQNFQNESHDPSLTADLSINKTEAGRKNVTHCNRNFAAW